MGDGAAPRFDHWTGPLGDCRDWSGCLSHENEIGKAHAKKQIVCLNSSISNKPNGMIDDMIRHARARFMSRPDDQKFSSTLDRDRLWRCNLRKELNVLPLRAWID